MRKFKNILAIFLSCMMTLGMGVVSFAEEPESIEEVTMAEYTEVEESESISETQMPDETIDATEESEIIETTEITDEAELEEVESLDVGAEAPSLTIYPEYDERIPRCYDYGVTVNQGSRSERLTVYNRNANGEQMSNRCFNPDFNRRFCEFAFTGEVRVDIEVRQDFTSYSVLPSAKEYRNEYHDGIISVWLDKNDTSFMIRLDDEDATILTVFADAPETYKYNPNDSSVLYVNQKWFDPNGDTLIYDVPSNIKTIYIEPGCVLYSRLRIRSNDVTVCGHGMIVDPYSDYYDTQSIDSSNKWLDNYRMVIRVEGSNITLKDFKLIDGQSWNIYLYDGYNHDIDNVKILTARITTDAVAVGSGNVSIENCVFYVSDNVFTYNGDRGYHHIKNCLIGTTCAAIFPQHQSLYDIDFMDIYVFRANEGIVNNWYNPARKQSEIKHITFENLDCVDMVHTPWIFNAHDMGDAQKYFTFKNCHFANIRGDSDIKSWNTTLGQAIYVDNSGKYEFHSSGYKIELFNCTLDGKMITKAADLKPQLPDGDEITFIIKNDKTSVPARTTKKTVNHVYSKKVYIGNYLLPLVNQPIIQNGTMYVPEHEICNALGVKVKPDTTGIGSGSVKYISPETIQENYTQAKYDANKKAVYITAVSDVKLNAIKDFSYTSRWNPYAFPNVILGPYVDSNKEVVLRCDVNVTNNAGMFANVTNDLKKTGSGKYTVSFDAKSTDGRNYAGEVWLQNIRYDGYKEIERKVTGQFTVGSAWKHFEVQLDLSKIDTADNYLSFIRICSSATSGYDVLFKNIKMEKVGATKEAFEENIPTAVKKNGFVEEGGKTYYYINDILQLGWQKIDNVWYYFGSDGAMATKKWVAYKGAWYYFNADGTMATNKWVSYKNDWYYFGSDGAMVTSKWVSYKGNWYYFNADGVMVTNKWIAYKGDWYYFNADGVMVTSKWIQYKNDWYYFNASGIMVTGTQTIGGRQYTFNSSGVWVK